MSKKAARRKKPRAAGRTRLSKPVLIALALSLASAGAALALWRPTPTAPAFTAATAVTPAQGSFSPSNPTKEYVYAGGRLVATEEPTPVPTPTPPPPCAPPSGLIVSEFRLRGPSGTADEFVEFYNATDSQITVCTADQS